MIKRSHAPSETNPDYLVDKFQLRKMRGKRDAITSLEGRSMAKSEPARIALRGLYRRVLQMQTDMF
jgi:hypothetical protein